MADHHNAQVQASKAAQAGFEHGKSSLGCRVYRILIYLRATYPNDGFSPLFFCGSSLLSRIQPALYTNSHEITLPCGELHMCACRKWKEKRERKEKIKIQDGCSVVPFHPAAAATACNVESPVRFGQDWMSQPIHISYILPIVQKTFSSDILDSFRLASHIALHPVQDAQRLWSFERCWPEWPFPLLFTWPFLLLFACPLPHRRLF